MLKIGIVGCGLQAATIASYLSVYGDEYEVAAVMDMNIPGSKARMAQKGVRIAENCVYTPDIDSFIASVPKLDGIIIGTYCTFHTDMACALEKLHIPLYIEKPVAINFEQVNKLYSTFRNSSTPIQVSLPMRLCPLTQEARKIIESGKIGKVCQVVGFEDTDGEVYFTTWFRDAEKTGGMFMQKAVHDIDYMLYLASASPDEVCAMRAKVHYRGDKAYEQTCDSCPDRFSCQHGPIFRFNERGLAESYEDALDHLTKIRTPDGEFLRKRLCAVSKDIAIEDIGSCIIRCKNGVQITHTQNFIASCAACRRGARFVGSLGSLDIDFNHGTLCVMSSVNNDIANYKVNGGKLSHYGGDRQLVSSFIHTMKTGERGITDLIKGDGIMSTLTCIAARESADSGKFLKVAFDGE
ncbi:MAG: Gfo/Idh/MocA family oxidoreductase [Lentisphaeria bacterium]|nr:Gfo/Idh/MocA family oxidoreductase [Lentisphaeria bacterium]